MIYKVKWLERIQSYQGFFGGFMHLPQFNFYRFIQNTSAIFFRFHSFTLIRLILWFHTFTWLYFLGFIHLPQFNFSAFIHLSRCCCWSLAFTTTLLSWSIYLPQLVGYYVAEHLISEKKCFFSFEAVTF